MSQDQKEKYGLWFQIILIPYRTQSHM
jgi:hypothetical protein